MRSQQLSHVRSQHYPMCALSHVRSQTRSITLACQTLSRVRSQHYRTRVFSMPMPKYTLYHVNRVPN